MIYYDRVQTDSPLQINLQVGSRTPIWCTASGKLYLSSLPKEKRQRLINNLSLTRYTRNTMVDGNGLETAVQQIKIRRLGIDNEEFVDGMVACAVPVTNSSGTLCACLFTHAPVIRKSLDSLLGYQTQLQSAAQELGYLIDNPDQ
jgi:DNA-binding IclR family transcriptional regulator